MTNSYIWILLFLKQRKRRKFLPLFKPQSILLEMSKNREPRLLPCESVSVLGAKLKHQRPAIHTGFSGTAKENFFPHVETTDLLFRIYSLIYKSVNQGSEGEVTHPRSYSQRRAEAGPELMCAVTHAVLSPVFHTAFSAQKMSSLCQHSWIECL